MSPSRWKLLFYFLTSPKRLVSLSERHGAWMNTPEAMDEKNQKLSEPYSARSLVEIRRALHVVLARCRLNSCRSSSWPHLRLV